MSHKEKRTARIRLSENLQHVSGKEYVCPVCPDIMNLSVVKQHILRMADVETLQKMRGLRKDTPHADFYLEHTELVVIQKRIWKI